VRGGIEGAHSIAKSAIECGTRLSNLEAAVTLYVAFYNICRAHQAHKGATPAMAAGLTDHVWSIQEMLEKK
jgi:hypothetical protein